MNLVRDISATFRAASVGYGTNWRANHALAALLISLGSLTAAGWVALFSDHPHRDHVPLLFLGMAIVCFGYWRYLLPEAIHRANIQRIYYADNPAQNKNPPNKNI